MGLAFSRLKWIECDAHIKAFSVFLLFSFFFEKNFQKLNRENTITLYVWYAFWQRALPLNKRMESFFSFFFLLLILSLARICRNATISLCYGSGYDTFSWHHQIYKITNCVCVCVRLLVLFILRLHMFWLIDHKHFFFPFLALNILRWNVLRV